ncbi:patatin-like phospholipase family protein [bacterium]|nr:patatin-like phospholipase family protein [bacterium]
MSVTIVAKSDPNVKKNNAKVALVLAGGAVSGGAYTLAGLKALNDLMVNRDVTDFDIFVGLSAGAFLAAPIAHGIGVEELLKSIDGRGSRFSQLKPLDFYSPNLSEFVSKPLHLVFDSMTMLPRFAVKFLSNVVNPEHQYPQALLKFLRRPNWKNADNYMKTLVRMTLASTNVPSPLSYLPAGIFDNRPLERYLRENFERNNRKNDFNELYFRRRKELYITALNLDTAERAIFGHDEDTSLSISEAVQASTALPGFFKPARIRGVDYLDGGVTTTANIDVAVEHGADLVIVFNPFRPFVNKLLVRFYKDLGTYVPDKPYLGDGGALAVLNQAFRTLLHFRLHHALKRFEQDPHFKGDIILIEPDLYDINFFEINPIAFWDRAKAAEHGFVSVKEAFDTNYSAMKRVLNSYGIETTMVFVEEDCRKIQGTPYDETVISILGKERIKRDIRLAM